MRRLLNNMQVLLHRIPVKDERGKWFYQKYWPILLGITAYLVWYNLYINSTSYSRVCIDYSSVNVNVDSMQMEFIIDTERANINPIIGKKGVKKYPRSGKDHIKIREFVNVEHNRKEIPLQYNPYHGIHFRKEIFYYLNGITHEHFSYLYLPLIKDSCDMPSRQFSMIRVCGHKAEPIYNTQDSQDYWLVKGTDSIVNKDIGYVMPPMYWFMNNYLLFRIKRLIEVERIRYYNITNDNCASSRNIRKFENEYITDGQMFHDFHSDFYYQIDFHFNNMGYDDSIKHNIPMRVGMYFNKNRRFLLDITPSADIETAHEIVYTSPEKIENILNDGIIISGANLLTKSYFQKLSTLLSLIIGVCVSIMAQLLINRVDNGFTLSVKGLIPFLYEFIYGLIIGCIIISIHLICHNPYTN